MNKKTFQLSLWILVFGMAQLCQAQEVVLAFGKTLAPSTSLDGTARTKMLINNMAKGDVKQAMFLVKTKNINAKTVDRVSFYDESGQLIVNAGDSLSIYHRAKNYSYPIDVMKANAKLLPYAQYHQHVFLPELYNRGDEKMLQQLRDFLAEHNYQRTYISYEAHDDYMDQLYQARMAENRTVDMHQMQTAYVNMLMDQVKDYDARARVLLGFSPRQVILLHENDLSAYCILAFIDALTSQGFKVIAPENVFSDPLANPFFAGGYSATGYMQAITNLPDPTRDSMFVITPVEEEKIHSYLREQGLDNLLPGHH